MAAAELAFGVFFVAGAHGGSLGFELRACGGFWFGRGCGRLRSCCRGGRARYRWSCWWSSWFWRYRSRVSHSIRSCVADIASATTKSKDLTERKAGGHRENRTALRSFFSAISSTSSPSFTSLLPCFNAPSDSVAAKDYAAGSVLLCHGRDAAAPAGRE